MQKIPYGIFDSITPNDQVGVDMMARANMVDDYYDQYYFVVNQVYSGSYSPQLEYEYNGTIGLLSNSNNPVQLFKLLASLVSVKLNVYDLELFVSKYIYYRTGAICAIYINDGVLTPGAYWILDDPSYSILDSTTILAPDSVTVIQNLTWTIYNGGTFSSEFQTEITNLILRISRADIGNTVNFSSIVDPTLDGFILIGPTYPYNPKLLYGQCILYVGDTLFPLNIIGYKKIGT